jgi:ribosome biogenesis protein Tsr3
MEQKNLLRTIAKNSNNKTLIIGKDEVMVYMSTVYSKAYPWISHPFTTPFIAKKEKTYREFIEKGIIDSSWKQREVIFVFQRKDTLESKRSRSLPFPAQILASTDTYILQKATIAY